MSEWVHANIELILYLTGIPTAGMLTLFFAPRFVLRTFVGVEPADYIGVFFVRAWGAVVGAIGLLLVAAVGLESLREPIMTAASFTKSSLVLMIAMNLNNALGKGLLIVLLFDAANVVLFLLYLSGAPVL